MSVRFEGNGLGCLRGGRMVFAGLCFAVEAGGALLVTGPNGSGKSSLLRVMAGLIRPAAGTLTWDGADIAADRAGHAARLHYVGHLDAAKPQMTVRETVRFWAGLRGGGPAAAEDALARFALSALGDAPVRLLSAGQRRRLGLARLVATEAPLWLLDEPSLGLDAASVERLLAAIATHRETGGIAVVSTNAALAIPEPGMVDVAAFAADEAA